MFSRSLSRSIAALVFALAVSQACPDAAAVPLATTQFNMTGLSCDVTVQGPSSKSCTTTFISTAGPDIVGTATFNDFGATSGGTALATENASSTGLGGGTGDAQAEFTYYVGIGIIATPPFMPAGIPVTFIANGGAFGSASGPNSAVGGEASTVVNEFQGDVSGFINVGVDETSALGGSINAPYSQTAQFVFDFDEGPPVAQVQLNALCGGAVGRGGSLSCTALADPFTGFDQAAFDALEGPNSFPLADFFALVLSDGVTIGPSAAPEPPVLSLLVLGLLIGILRLRQPIRNSSTQSPAH